ncbi:MAG: oxygen-dependent coproporphyrinogen oxidase [Acidimicrobiia bacterium]|nr:oxygen-dependent coproporphyrinogen oxidase [Acidimicrobiia bacterium]
MERTTIEAWYRGFQERFAGGIENLDGSAVFRSDPWEREDGGGGDTRVLAGGAHIEKAAVNFSAVHGPTPARLSERLAAAGSRFYATGVSIIVHPQNPHAPTFHANVRYFESDTGAAWFGGGADLTPYYLYEEDAVHFHRVLREACGRHAVADHPAWKQACDDYFHLPHRGEARGVGGIFFDHLTERLDEVWAFQQDLADHLLEAYLPILRRRVDLPVDDEQRRWHELRRGRYVEFNLIWDRGTRFGLETGGRTESILGSMPPRARWEYAHEPPPGTPEAELLAMVRAEPRDWS